MKNPLGCCLTVVLMLASTTCTPAWSNPAPVQKYPNILLVIADDIGYADYGFAGHPLIHTPNLDHLAHDGVVFTNGYSANSICRPSLASLITGLYPSQHGITVNARFINQQRGRFDWGLPPYASRMQTLDTLPKELAKLGYHSLQAGKWWEEGYANGGFTEGDKAPEGLLRHVTRRNVIGREGLEPVFSFIDRNKQQPFFIWYAPQMPHVPHNPPQSFLALYQQAGDVRIAKYYGMVSWFDDTVGQIMQHLEQTGLRDNTIIIYIGDNGYSIHSDVLEDESHRGKDSPYEAGIRTPIIFNWPKTWSAAQRTELASSMDIFPTLMDLLQQKPATTLPGHSLLPALNKGPAPTRNAIMGESFIDRGEERFDNALAFRWLRFREDDGGNWKFIHFADGHNELYDLDHDAGEQHNLAGDNTQADRLQRAQKNLDRIFH